MAIHTAFPADGFTARWQTWDDDSARGADAALGERRLDGHRARSAASTIHYVIRLSPTWQVRQFLLFRDLDEPDLWLAPTATAAGAR